MQDRVQAMQVFLRVAELQSFTAASVALDLSKTYVSTLVQQLENHLGSRLLQRTTRRVQLTQDGQLFYQRCKDLLAEFDEVESLFQQQNTEVAGRLRIDMPTVMARSLLFPKLSQFLALYPKVEFEVSCTDRKMDLVAEGFDCVVRVGAVEDLGLIAKTLPSMPLLNLASPAYLAKFGTPIHPDELTGHQLVHYAPHFAHRDCYFEYLDAGKLNQRTMAAAITVNNTDAYATACLAGLGIIQAPIGGVRHLLESGQLQQILPAWRAPAMPVSMLYPHRRHIPVRLRLFMQWFESELNSYLTQAEPAI
ncbi:MAG: LysR family transcriptional regulator [Gammaproteobacteria bacterium]|nr:LysR family transcriptional regulator [Gammaproteobacteria bacterium]MBU2279037.1 LysR family transcriptional regulator [Gammaproteobacteria bacterium]MBU2426025.1 LysR family transcriptional regulator [Gammaproteobacteria bacterium]